MLEEKKNISGEEPVQDKTEQTKQDMAKVYGISLTDIEEVILPNGTCTLTPIFIFSFKLSGIS